MPDWGVLKGWGVMRKGIAPKAYLVDVGKGYGY